MNLNKDQIFEAGYRTLKSEKFIKTAGGASILGWIGSGIGIAGFGTAIPGLIPFAIAGGLFGYAHAHGYRIVNKKKKTGESHDS